MLKVSPTQFLAVVQPFGIGNMIGVTQIIVLYTDDGHGNAKKIRVISFVGGNEFPELDFEIDGGQVPVNSLEALFLGPNSTSVPIQQVEDITD